MSRLFHFQANIRLARKTAPAYFCWVSLIKKFYNIDTTCQYYKTFFLLTEIETNKLECLSLASFSEYSFGSKSGAYPSEAPYSAPPYV